MSSPMSRLADEQHRSAADSQPSTGLNPDQLDAVVHRGGPLLVVAGAGSGKTRVLTHRIAHLIDEGVPPTAILAITFTNKAADEMRRRVAELVGPVTRAMWVSTFHSACVRILRAHADLLGYPRQFSIYDQADATRLTGYVIRDLGLDSKRFTPRGVHGDDQPLEERARRPRCRPRPGRSTSSTASTPRSTPSTRSACVPAGAMDFDDLLVNTVELFRRAPRRPRGLPPALRARPRRRVPGHQRRPERARPAARRRPRQRHRRRRQRPVDLPLPRRRLAQHRAVRGRLPRGRHDGRARPELPQHADDPRRRQRRHRQQRRAQAEAPVDRRRQRRPDRALLGRGRDRRGPLRRRDRPRPAQHRRRQLARDRRAVPHQRPEPGRRGVVDAPRRALQGGRRHPLLRPPGDPRRHGLPARRRQPGRRGERQAHPQRAQAGDRRHERRQARSLRGDDRGGLRRRPAPRRASRRDRPGAARHRRRSSRLLDSLAARLAGDAAGPAELLQAALEGSGYRAELEAEDTVEAPRTAGEPRRADRLGPRVHPRRRVPRAGVARRRHRRAPRRRGRGPGRAADAALGEGPRVPGRLPHRRRGGRVPEQPGAQRARRHGGGAPPRLRRHHPGPQPPVHHPRVEPQPVRRRPRTTRRRGSSRRSPTSSSTTRQRLRAHVVRSPEHARPPPRRATSAARRPYRRRRGGDSVDPDRSDAHRDRVVEAAIAAGRAAAGAERRRPRSACASATTSSTRRGARAS